MPPLVLITPLVIVVLFLGFFCLPVNRMAITSLREQVPGARPLSKAVRKRYAFDDRFLDFPTHSLDGTPSE
ncbi:MAG: uncharacterized protein KVP18_003066 [Porospora cf. gigantea A]|uniref:uncharacterized protein n=1 Tax=Porospora cf. gigantea A TaxID=2853593 RepID=UPI003559DC8C|nr:MAG: hypothetical protein KVP18_003066 [Porospora cf. gigantea A]